MFDKLEVLLVRYQELMAELNAPDVASDSDRLRRLMKEQAELEPLVRAYEEYKAAVQTEEESLELLESEKDRKSVV